MNERGIYLDFNASTPLAPEVVKAMGPFLTEHFGNPSSRHWAGAPASAAVERARGHVASLLGCEPDEVVFTSGAARSHRSLPSGENDISRPLPLKANTLPDAGSTAGDAQAMRGGGTSLVTLMAGFGILMSVHSRRKLVST